MHLADLHPVIIRQIEKDYQREFDFRDLKFLVKIRDICKVEKGMVSLIDSVFVLKSRGKKIQSMAQKYFQGTCWFAIAKRRNSLCSYQRF